MVASHQLISVSET
jgi:hypothetical protein